MTNSREGTPVPRMMVNGFEMHYVIDDYTDPWLPADTIIMHHGFGRSHKWWYGWPPTLARHYRVIRFDARGMGDSQTPPYGFRWSVESFAEDLQCLIDGLGLEKVHFIGESLGGIVGATFGAIHPERLWTLTLCGTPIQPTPKPAPGYPSNAASLRAVGHWAMTLNEGVDDPSAIGRLRRAWTLMELRRTSNQLGYAREEMGKLPSTNITAVLPRIKVPTLLLTPGQWVKPDGSDDQSMMARTIPHCKQVVIPDVGGWLLLMRPEECAEATLAFIREQTKEA